MQQDNYPKHTVNTTKDFIKGFGQANNQQTLTQLSLSFIS